jgi:rod shape-determining protein MreC
LRKFFARRSFKILVAAVCVLVAISIGFTLFGGRIAPHSDLLSMVLTPVRSFSTSVADTVDRVFTAVGRLDTIETENNRLREEIRGYREQLVEYDQYKQENAFYKQFLEIKEQHSDYTFQPATVTARDAADASASFSIDVGTKDGVALHDPVITKDGLVGYISQVGTTASTVSTVIDPSLRVGALVSRTREAGVISGDAHLMAEGACRLSYLKANSAVTVGDYVITSGDGGMFPKGLIIGTVADVKKEQSNVSLYGVIKPVVDVQQLTQVMVITHFEGQGGIGNE